MFKRCFIVILTAISALLLAGCGDFLSEGHDPKSPAPLNPTLLPEICQINPKGYCLDIAMKHHRFVVPLYSRVAPRVNSRPDAKKGQVTTYKNVRSFKFKCCIDEVLQLIDLSNGEKILNGRPEFELHYAGDRYVERETFFSALDNMDISGNSLKSYNDDFWEVDIHPREGFVLLSKEPLFRGRQVIMNCTRSSYIHIASTCYSFTFHALGSESKEFSLSTHNMRLRPDDLPPCPDYNVKKGHIMRCRSFTVSEYIEEFPAFIKKIEAFIVKLEVTKY